MAGVADEVALIVKAQDWVLLRSYFANKFERAFKTTDPHDLRQLAEVALVWGRLFLPTYIRDESPPVHVDFLAKRFSARNEYDAMPRGFAKAQSLDSRVLTPTGWVRMGDLTQGDFVMGADGKAKKILGFSPTTEMDLYRLSTRDGRSTLCNLDHLWEVTCPSNTGKKKVVKKTSEILKNFKSQRLDKRTGTPFTEYRYFIDTCAPLKFKEKELPLDPYTLGLWLGDGTSANGTVTSNDPEVFSYIPYEWKKTKAAFRYQIYGIQPLLRDLHLLQNKHIPEMYKFASVEQRLALLQGLIDSDGYIFRGGKNFSYTSARKRLFDDVVDLIRSLGGTVTTAEQLTRFDKNSEYKLSYTLSARLRLCPARLKRKASGWVGSLKTKAAISDISFEKKGLGRCMKVEDELYITDDYLVTHNTTMNQLLLCIVAAHHLRNFAVVLEKTFTEASEVLNVLRDEFSHNDLLLLVYGSLMKTSSDGVFDDRNKDAEGDIFINSVRFRGKGFNTPVRGLKSLEYRPDLILIDDVEEDTHIRSEEQRRKYRENYAQGIVPAVDVEGVIKVTGTILHQDSLLQNLIDQFGGTVYRAYDPTSPTPEQTLLWPARWTWKRLMEKKEQMEMEGKGSSKFFQEYLNQPVDDMRRVFKQEYYQHYYTAQDVKNVSLFRSIAIDPAESKKQGSDWTAVTVVDTDQNNNWYVRFVKRYRVNSAELIQLIFDLWNTWKPQVIGVERKAFEDQIKPFMDIKAQETGTFPHVVELEHGGQRKEDRIVGSLQGRFESGKILFQENPLDDTRVLHGELYDFPFGKNDDLCLVGETMVLTPFGEVPIKDIRVGDFVVTRKGFRRVLASMCTGEKEVISSIGLEGTPNHPVITKNGIKDLQYVNESDIIYRWNEKQSCIEEGSITATRSQNEDTSEFTSGHIEPIARQRLFTGKCGWLKLALSQMGLLSTIKMAILSIIRYLTLNSCIAQFMQKCIRLNQNAFRNLREALRLLALRLQSGMGQMLVLLGIENMRSDHCLASGKNLFVWNAKKHFGQTLFNKPSFAHGSATGSLINENGEKSTQTTIKRVYNLQIEGVNEFFANSILVHNCDSLAYNSQLSKRPYGGATAVASSMAKEFADMKKKLTRRSIVSKL